VAYHNWFALPERPVSDARAPFVLPEYLKMALSKNIMSNVARFRIRGHGLKCETGVCGRSPDRSARVCNLCENGDYIYGDKHVIFSCMGTKHLRHQFNHLFDNVFEGDIKGFVQHNSYLSSSCCCCFTYNRWCAFPPRKAMATYQRGLTEEIPEIVNFCIQKAATHSHFIQSTPF
jgi:hypothetical protein